jgi:hypothetical protein
MQLKGRVSKKLEGSVCIPTIAQKAMIANEPFQISEEQFWKADVQRALQTKKIVFTSKLPTLKKEVILTNISEGSISVPGNGIVRTGHSIRLPSEATEKAEIVRMYEAGTISLNGKRKFKAKKAKRRERGAIVIDRQYKKKKASDFNPIAWNPKESPFVEDMEPEFEKDDESGISWVDAEQTKDRLAKHPKLGKLHAKNSVRKGQKPKNR